MISLPRFGNCLKALLEPQARPLLLQILGFFGIAGVSWWGFLGYFFLVSAALKFLCAGYWKERRLRKEIVFETPKVRNGAVIPVQASKHSL